MSDRCKVCGFDLAPEEGMSSAICDGCTLDAEQDAVDRRDELDQSERFAAELEADDIEARAYEEDRR